VKNFWLWDCLEYTTQAEAEGQMASPKQLYAKLFLAEATCGRKRECDKRGRE